MAPINQRSFLFAGLAAALAIIIWLNRETGRLQDKVRKLEGELTSLQNLHQSKTVMATPPPDQQVNSTVQAPPAPEEATGPSASPGRDSAWRNARFNEAILRVEARYGRLFSRLKDWSPEQREALKRLLADNELRLILSLQSDAPLTPAGIQTRFDALSQTRTENDLRLREMMGEQDYAKLDSFERERASLESVSTIANAMRSNGVDVSGDLEDSLLKSYAAAMQDATREASKVDIRALKPEQLADLTQQQHRAFQLILLKRMSGVLEGKQLDAFMAAVIEQQEPASP